MKRLGELITEKSHKIILDSIMLGGKKWKKYVDKDEENGCLENDKGCPAYKICIGDKPDKNICSENWHLSEANYLNLEIILHVIENFEYYNKKDLDYTKSSLTVKYLINHLQSLIKERSTFANKVSMQLLKEFNLHAKPENNCQDKYNMLLKIVSSNEYIQIMRYGKKYYLSWAMVPKKAIQYINIEEISTVEFDDDKNKIKDNYPENRFKNSSNNEHSAISKREFNKIKDNKLFRKEDNLWHLVIAKEDLSKESDKIIKWIMSSIKGFKERMGEVEEKDDSGYQINIQRAKPKKIPRKPQVKPKTNIQNGIKQWVTDPSIGRQAIKDAQYTCACNPKHETFTSKSTGKNYVEVHHLIPMKLQAEVKNSLDVPANLISLCPNCHRRFHHAIDKENKSLIVEFYEKRKKALKKFAIDIGVDKLL